MVYIIKLKPKIFIYIIPLRKQDTKMEKQSTSIFTMENKDVTTISSEGTERQSGPSKQDIVRWGVRKDGSPWLMVADGHGSNLVIYALRNQDWNMVMNLDDHFAFIEDMIRKLGNTAGSGATMSTVIMAKDGMHCRWRGDSQIKIFENGKEVFSTTPHNAEHREEAERMKCHRVQKQSFTILALTPTELTMVSSNYYLVGTKTNQLGQEVPDIIAMTNALGHNEGSGGKPELAFISKHSGSEYMVVVASDGLWDMMCKEDVGLIATSSANQLADIANARWEQEWDYTYPNPRVYRGTEREHEIKTSKQRMDATEKDDIGVVVWRGTYD